MVSKVIINGVSANKRKLSTALVQAHMYIIINNTFYNITNLTHYYETTSFFPYDVTHTGYSHPHTSHTPDVHTLVPRIFLYLSSLEIHTFVSPSYRR